MISYDAAKIKYTCGMCHVLAWELKKHFTDWLLAKTDQHAFIVSPDKKYAMDIKGITSLKDMLFEWIDDDDDEMVNFPNNGEGEEHFLREVEEFDAELNPNEIDETTKYYANYLANGIMCPV